MPYLTVADYVERFGRVETVRITDETKTGVIDDGKVEKAIEDAGAEVDSYLAVRYALPIAGSPPAVVTNIVADIARLRLHRASPTDIVVKNAERAYAQLRDISAGRAAIPLDPVDGGGVVGANGGHAVSSMDGRPRVFTDCSLSDFVNLGYPSGRTVFDGPQGW